MSVRKRNECADYGGTYVGDELAQKVPILFPAAVAVGIGKRSEHGSGDVGNVNRAMGLAVVEDHRVEPRRNL